MTDQDLTYSPPPVEPLVSTRVLPAPAFHPATLLLLKGALLLAVVVAAHVFIFSTYRAKDQLVLPELMRVRDLETSGADILYFGDSTLSPDSKSKVATYQALQPLLTEHRVAPIAHPAYHLGIYRAYTERILAGPFRPKYVIVTINMRSFSASWERRPEWQFEEATFLLRNSSYLTRALFGPLRIFKGFDLVRIQQDEFEATPVFDGEVKAGVVRDFMRKPPDMSSEQYLARTIVYHYMFALDRDHRRLQEAVELARMLRDNGITPIFYVTPVDYRACHESLGDRFDRRLADNIEVVESALAEEGAAFLDLSRLLESEVFNWEGEPNEHVFEPGRVRIADELARFIRTLDER